MLIVFQDHIVKSHCCANVEDIWLVNLENTVSFKMTHKITSCSDVSVVIHTKAASISQYFKGIFATDVNKKHSLDVAVEWEKICSPILLAVVEKELVSMLWSYHSVVKCNQKQSQNSQENTCARVSFLIKLQVRPAKFLRISFFIERLRWLLLCYQLLNNDLFINISEIR